LLLSVINYAIDRLLEVFCSRYTIKELHTLCSPYFPDNLLWVISNLDNCCHIVCFVNSFRSCESDFYCIIAKQFLVILTIFVVHRIYVRVVLAIQLFSYITYNVDCFRMN